MAGPVEWLLLLGFNQSPQLIAFGGGLTQLALERFLFRQGCLFELLLQAVNFLLGSVELNGEGLDHSSILLDGELFFAGQQGRIGAVELDEFFVVTAAVRV